MRLLANVWLLFSVLAVQGQGQNLPLEELLTTSQYREYQKKQKYRDQIKIFREAIEQRFSELRQKAGLGQPDSVKPILGRIRSLAQHAYQRSREEQNQKEKRHKEVKKLEISLRKHLEELDDLALSVPLEDRPHFESVGAVLEELRQLLLRQLFGREVFPPKGSFQLAGATVARASVAPHAALQLWALDRFTEAEYTKIQDAQELRKRVDAFLEIAEARMNEIERRLAGKEWEDEKKENPLEFFTYEDLLFGYTRALDGTMKNIDEHANYRRSSDKDIRKALEALNKKVENFTPRLKAMEEMVMSSRDEALYRQYQEALESTDIARKGTQYGLGAPAQ